jgi:hypothetical protein
MNKDLIFDSFRNCITKDCDKCNWTACKQMNNWKMAVPIDLALAVNAFMAEELKEQEGLLGIQQTADSIAFISTGTAKQGEDRGIMLGKSWMHEWLKKELLHRGLLTDEIRSVFDDAKRI